MKELEYTVGALLAQTRESLGKEVAEVASDTGLKQEFILNLESHNYNALPHDIYTATRVKKYAQSLGLDGDKIKKQYLEERGEIPHATSLRRSNRFKSPIVTSSLLPKAFLVLSVVAIIAYISYQVMVAAGSPRLSVSSPYENQVVYTEEVEIIGRTNPDATLSIDGREVLIEEDGSFKYELVLPEGRHTLRLEARNNLGRSTTVVRNFVIYIESD